MRRVLSIPVLALGLTAVILVPISSICAWGQQQQQPSSAPGAPPPAPPQPPSTQPNKNCSGQAQRGSQGPWKTSSTCPPPAPSTTQSSDTPSLQPAQGSTQQPRHSTAEDNPFPEDVSAKAAAASKDQGAGEEKPAAPDASGDAPAANTGESSSREKLDKADHGDLPDEKNSRISNGAGGVIYNPKMAGDDVRVGEFYMNRGDYKGAYERFKEASQVDPGSAEAVFNLAQAARKMNRNDEAVQNYQIYLDALPNGPRAKDARKGLRDLSASAKH